MNLAGMTKQAALYGEAAMAPAAGVHPESESRGQRSGVRSGRILRTMSVWMALLTLAVPSCAVRLIAYADQQCWYPQGTFYVDNDPCSCTPWSSSYAPLPQSVFSVTCSDSGSWVLTVFESGCCSGAVGIPCIGNTAGCTSCGLLQMWVAVDCNAGKPINVALAIGIAGGALAVLGLAVYASVRWTKRARSGRSGLDSCTRPPLRCVACRLY